MNKNFLLISPFAASPLLQGSIVRTHYWARYLAEQHQVWFVSRAPSDPKIRPNLTPIPTHPNRLLQMINPPLIGRLTQLIRREKIDLILLSHFWSCPNALALHQLTGVPLWFDNHNIEYIRLQREKRRIWPIVKQLERWTCQSAERVITVSETDRQGIAQLGIDLAKISVSENGADVSALWHYPTQQTLKFDRPVVLFFGTATHRPNRQAIDLIVEKFAPQLPHHLFVIAGSGGHAYRDQLRQPPPNLHFTDFIDDIHGLIKSADLVIAPLQAGSGTRYKIIESAACGKSILSTTIGAEGLDRDAFGNALTICDDWTTWIELIAEKCRHPQLWQPTPAFYARYDWHTILNQLEI